MRNENPLYIEDLRIAKHIRDFERPWDWAIVTTYLSIACGLILFWGFVIALYTLPKNCGEDVTADWYEECLSNEEINLNVER